MREVDSHTKLQARLYLGIPEGLVVGIVKDARDGKFPRLDLRGRIDELHSLSSRLRKETLDLAQAKLAFTLLGMLWKLGVEPGRLKELIDFCARMSPDPPEGFVPVAMDLFQLAKETGKTYVQFAQEVKELQTQRERQVVEVGDLRT